MSQEKNEVEESCDEEEKVKECDALARKCVKDGLSPQTDNCLLSVKLGAETCFLGYGELDAQ